jgi:hypothetical protein
MDTSGLGPVWVIALTFVPTFICGSLLRSKGLLGWLAIAGIVGVGAMLFLSFVGWRLGVGGLAAFIGLAAGGKLSDMRDHERMKRAAAREKKERDDRMKRNYTE